ncbi:sigma-70 family RNA polymerase sigma factor [Tardiphaga sp. 866_E4_N2_1]|uniref:sigma-70 family RNA polymerase sigma factor n=1 Tax=unclassified Tardiphaga TaxID=2631404 RepID=UPI003F239C8E
MAIEHAPQALRASETRPTSTFSHPTDILISPPTPDARRPSVLTSCSQRPLRSELNWRRQILRRALDQLKPRELRIIEARWLADTPVTLDELAAELSVSRERVRQLEVRALEKARAYAVSLLSADVRDRPCARADTVSSPSGL